MLKNRVYIVTGGATGIGAGITAVLGDYGAHVEIFQPENCDVRDPVQVDAETAKVLDPWGLLDGLVNNAALTGPVDPSKIEDILATNLKGPIYCSQSFARRAVERGRPGAIVNIASVGAFAAQENASIYCVSKAALVALTQSMALELAEYRIRVNAVAPGDIQTVASFNIAPGRFPRSTPWGRRGTPEEIGQAVAFLLSDNSSFTTGSTLTVDGGLLTY